MRERIPLKIGPGSIGWGILGTGMRAQQIVTQAIRQQPAIASDTAGAWVVGVYSHSERRAQMFAQDHYIPHSFPNLADLCQRQEIQCIYIAGHPRHHYPLAMAALSAGKHVLVESPLALIIDEAQTLQQAAEHRGLLLAVSHPLRADPAIQQMKLLLSDGDIGDILGCRITNTTPLSLHQQSWRLQPNGGGVLFQRTYHAIDLLQYLLQDTVATIYSTGSQQILGERIPGGQQAQSVEEDIHSLITLRHHAFTAQLHDAFFIPHIPTLLELYGSRGALQIQHWADPTEESTLWLVRNQFAERITLRANNPDRQMIFAFNQSVREQRMANHHQQPITMVNPHAGLATPQAGIQALTVVVAARQSLWSQRPITLANLTN